MISAAKLASVDYVGRQNTLNRIVAFGPGRNFSAAPHSHIPIGASVAVHNRINPARVLPRNDGRAPRMMAPKSVEYHVDVLSLLAKGRGQALRGLMGQPGSANAASLGYFTFSGVR